MVDLTPLIATGKRLLAENGREVTFVSYTDAPTDPAKPWQGNQGVRTGAETTFVTDAAFVPPSSIVSLGLRFTSEDALKRAEQIMIVVPELVDLDGFEIVRDSDASEWQIQFIEELKPGQDAPGLPGTPISALAYVGVRR